MNTKVPVISIDGPSAAGKGTLSLLLAQRLGFHYLDSGALYRLAGLLAIRSNTFPTPKVLAAQLRKQDFCIEEPVTTALRDEAVSQAASRVAGWPEVRLALRDCQRKALVAPGLIADGRDMGTQVFPDANLKFFLTASLDARAKRRHQQLQSLPNCPSLEEVTSLIINRDQSDETRHIAPLKPAADAVHIDSTELSIAKTLEVMLQEVQKRGLLSK